MQQIELLAPGGDVDSIKAAVLAGANAVYCGLDRFNARNRAANISIENLPGILRFVHSHGAQLFLTLNILIVESEFPSLVTLLNRIANSSVDAVIVQDLGLFYLLKMRFPSLVVHASTQTTTHNRGQIPFLRTLGATRVNLSRELELAEIRQLTAVSHEHGMETEVFVHGSNCISFSGQCFISSVHSGNSGNRGRCSQPCRDSYQITEVGSEFPLNLKDNCAFENVKDLTDCGVDSLKIEGRIKAFHYVFTVVDQWNRQLNRIREGFPTELKSEQLKQVFNRDFSTAFLSGKRGKSFFSESPMDHSAKLLMNEKGVADLQVAKNEIHQIRTKMITDHQAQIDAVSVEKGSCRLIVEGSVGNRLVVSVEMLDCHRSVARSAFSIEDHDALRAQLRLEKQTIKSGSSLFHTDYKSKMITEESLRKLFKSLDSCEYSIDQIDCSKLQTGVTIGSSELANLKKQIGTILNSGREPIESVEFPKPFRRFGEPVKSSLMVLIDSADQIDSCGSADEIGFELPNEIGIRFDELVDLFQSNRNLMPWFPSILIGDNFESAVAFLESVQPSKIVTNNSGIAFECLTRRIAWIAGPQFNVINSMTLECLQNEFGCVGAFISNELSRTQILPIRKPESFKLYYSIYHPILLMTSRQCLLLSVIDCGKTEMDSTCVAYCNRHATIRDKKGNTLWIDKQAGQIHSIYNDQNYLNLNIVNDIPDLFDSFAIDLRHRKSGTTIATDERSLIDLFGKVLDRESAAADKIRELNLSVTSDQYSKGI